MKEVKIGELFAGVGGFRLGFERADKKFFKTVYANQWEPSRKTQSAFNIYKKRFNDNGFYTNENISIENQKLEKKNNYIPSIDILVGGFPCQDYSVARTKAKGIEGKKGVLWWEILKVVKIKKPVMLLFENVDRLLVSPNKAQKGKDFLIMLRSLYENEYNVEWRVVNAADYGSFQKRKRIYIYCWKNKLQKLNKNLEKLNQSILTKELPIEKKNRKIK